MYAEVPAPERHDLFLQKLHQCGVVFDFNDASTDIGGKQIKAATLAEMLEWITTQRGVITESVYPEVVAMVRRAAASASSPICRQADAARSTSSLPTSSDRSRLP